MPARQLVIVCLEIWASRLKMDAFPSKNSWIQVSSERAIDSLVGWRAELANAVDSKVPTLVAANVSHSTSASDNISLGSNESAAARPNHPPQAEQKPGRVLVDNG